MGTVLAFPERKPAIVYACVEVPASGKGDPREGLLRIGPFGSLSKAREWEHMFRVSCMHKNILVQLSWTREVTLPFKRRFDFDPATEDGMPWEAALSLLSFEFPEEQRRVAAWCIAAHS
jgi:hypothetical protein